MKIRGQFNGDFCCSFRHGWRTIKDTVVTAYQICVYCDSRRIIQQDSGYQPVDYKWLIDNKIKPSPSALSKPTLNTDPVYPKEKVIKPTIGRIVNFILEDMETYAAIIISVHSDTCVSLTVFTSFSGPMVRTLVTEGTEIGTWQWPQKKD